MRDTRGVQKKISETVIPHIGRVKFVGRRRPMHPSKLALVPRSRPLLPHSLRPSAIEGHPIYITARNRMRSSGGHSNETTKSKGRKKERMKDAGGKRRKKRRAACGRVKKKEKEREARGRNVEMQTDGVLRDRVLFLPALLHERRELPEELPEKLFSLAGRSPQARSLPTLSANGYL